MNRKNGGGWKKSMEVERRSRQTFICVLLFWNQNLIWRGSSPSSLLRCILCFSSGWGHSLNILKTDGPSCSRSPRRGSCRGEARLPKGGDSREKKAQKREKTHASSACICLGVWR